MGHEVFLVAVSDLTGLQEALSAGRLQDASVLGLLSDLLTACPEPEVLARQGGPFDPDRFWLASWGLRMVSKRPELGRCRVDLDRRYAWLGWVLDALDPGCSAAVSGRHALPAPGEKGGVAVGWQGHPLLVNGPSDCLDLSHRLEALDAQQVAEGVRPDAMRELYKFGDKREHDGTVELIVADFLAVRTFYGEVARFGEAVLVVKG